MFKVNKTPTFTRDVEIVTPGDNGVEVQTLRTTFQVVPDIHTTLTNDAQMIDYVKDRVATFHELVDENDTPIICDDDLCIAMIRRPDIRNALFKAYTKEIISAKAGN